MTKTAGVLMEFVIPQDEVFIRPYVAFMDRLLTKKLCPHIESIQYKSRKIDSERMVALCGYGKRSDTGVWTIPLTDVANIIVKNWDVVLDMTLNEVQHMCKATKKYMDVWMLDKY